MKTEKKRSLTEYIKKYEPMISAMVDLFHPHLEIAIHRLDTGELVSIYNNISKRNIGDKIPTRVFLSNKDQLPQYYPFYFKRNWNGDQLKCTTTFIRNEENEPIGLICFNYDIQTFLNIGEIANRFATPREAGSNPLNLYIKNPTAEIGQVIQEIIKEKKLPALDASKLTYEEKSSIVQELYFKGVFNLKNSISSVAQILNLTRPTIYKYLDTIGDQK